MNYYFDVKLNFLDNLYNYYEWDKDDNVLDVKKIPLVKLSFQDFLKVYTKKIVVDKQFLESILNKTSIKNGFLEYAAIFTDSNNSFAVLFNEKGESILYSALSYADELNIEEIGFKLKKEKLDFSVLENKKFLSKLRFDEKMKEFVEKEIQLLIENKEYSKLKYIYNEAYKVLEKDIDVAIKRLSNIENIKTSDFISLYNVIKLSCKNV